MLGLKSASYWTHSAATAASFTYRNSAQVVSIHGVGEAEAGHRSSDAGIYLGHGFRWVIVVQLGIHALLDFVLAQSRSGLDRGTSFFRQLISLPRERPGVRVAQYSAMEEPAYPGDQALLPLGHGVIHGFPPGQELKEHDAEAVDVALLRQLACHRVPDDKIQHALFLESNLTWTLSAA
jgi:hypothetical protein